MYLYVKKTFEVFGLNYDAVFEDGGYAKVLFFERFV